MKGEYYLGLDMGSSSVGWAVTNEKYEILRAHEKHFGVYGYLTVHRLQKREEGFGQQNEDWIVVIGE